MFLDRPGDGNRFLFCDSSNTGKLVGNQPLLARYLQIVAFLSHKRFHFFH